VQAPLQECPPPMHSPNSYSFYRPNSKQDTHLRMLEGRKHRLKLI
jgi:hypothetical protein